MGEEIEVSVMHRAEGHFKWPKEDDKIFYMKENIVKKILHPSQLEIRDNLHLMKIFER